MCCCCATAATMRTTCSAPSPACAKSLLVRSLLCACRAHTASLQQLLQLRRPRLARKGPQREVLTRLIISRAGAERLLLRM